MFFVLSIIRIYRICLTRPLDSLENCGNSSYRSLDARASEATSSLNIDYALLNVFLLPRHTSFDRFSVDQYHLPLPPSTLLFQT
jgi:hypothetical protein